MIERVHELLQSADRPRVCIIGDMMLDTYIYGGVARISPEGPIPVLKAENRENRAGGAGSVAAMLAQLGADTRPVGIVGSDNAGDAFCEELSSIGIDTSGIVRSPHRPTTTKTRFLGYVQSAGRAMQQLLRVDDEQTHELCAAETESVLAAVEHAIACSDVAVIQDMGKGLLNDALNQEIIGIARGAGKPVVVDPERREDYSAYSGATCILPNRFEAQMATGIDLYDESSYRAAADRLLTDLSLDAAIVKLDREGMYLATREGDRQHITTRAQQVADVTGAGDMVTAAVSFALAAGTDFALAAVFANFAAGMEVSYVGATPIGRQVMLDALQIAADPALRKIKERSEMVRLRDELRSQGSKVAFTNGCFDLLHLGHTQLIRYARAQGDALIVGINTDRSVRELKGPERPINSQDVRAHILAALSDVDYVVMFDETSVLPLIQEIRPDVLVKGGDYGKSGVVGHEFVESYGGRVELAPEAKGFSTTDIIHRIAGNGGGG